MNRLPSLDGLRGLSILIVIGSHIIITPGFINTQLKELMLGFVTGDLGVNIFFVISGFIITRLLLIEEERTGNISLKSFYLRRIVRIFPAYYFFLLLIFCVIISKSLPTLIHGVFCLPSLSLPDSYRLTLVGTWPIHGRCQLKNNFTFFGRD